MRSLKLEDRINDPSTIWRVLHLVEGESCAQIVYYGRGKQAKEIAEKKYDTVILDKGRIGLYMGIRPLKIRKAYELTKV